MQLAGGQATATTSARREITDASLQKARQYCEISVVGGKVNKANSAQATPPQVTDANLQKARQYCEISVVGAEVNRANSAQATPPQTPDRPWPPAGPCSSSSHERPASSDRENYESLDAEKASLAAEAISQIMEQIRQQGSPAYVWIHDWPARYQSSLGQLKVFIESCSEHFEIVMEPGYSRKYRVALKANSTVRHVVETSSPMARDRQNSNVTDDDRSWQAGSWNSSWHSWKAGDNACAWRDDSWGSPSRRASEDKIISKEEVLQWFLGHGARDDGEWVLSKLKTLRPDLLPSPRPDRTHGYQ